MMGNALHRRIDGDARRSAVWFLLDGLHSRFAVKPAIDQHRFDFWLHLWLYHRQSRNQLLLVIGRLTDLRADNQHILIDRRLRVVGLLEMSAGTGLHDPALRI